MVLQLKCPEHRTHASQACGKPLVQFLVVENCSCSRDYAHLVIVVVVFRTMMEAGLSLLSMLTALWVDDRC